MTGSGLAIWLALARALAKVMEWGRTRRNRGRVGNYRRWCGCCHAVEANCCEQNEQDNDNDANGYRRRPIQIALGAGVALVLTNSRSMASIVCITSPARGSPEGSRSSAER